MEEQIGPKKGMKLWIKIVIGLAVFMLLVCSGGGLLIYKMGSDLMKGFTDDAEKLKRTRSICAIVIPKDYSIQGAFEFAGFKFSMLTHTPTAQDIMFMRMPPSTCSDKELRESFNDEKFAQEILNQNKSGRQSLEIEKVKSSEKTTINGQEFAYALCDFKQQGKKKEGIIGYFTDPSTEKGFLVFSFNNPGSYNNDVTIKLLENVGKTEPEVEQ